MDDKIVRYLGSFQLDGDSLPGEIIHNKEAGTIRLRLTATFDNHRDLIMACNPVPPAMDNMAEETIAERAEHAKKVRLYNCIGFITGKLNNNTPVTLFNCRCVSDKSYGHNLCLCLLDILLFP